MSDQAKTPKLFFRGATPMATAIRTYRNYVHMNYDWLTAVVGGLRAGIGHALGTYG